MRRARACIVRIAATLAGTLAAATTPRRTQCDLRVTDSVERDIERRLMSGHQSFRSSPFRC
jgi:hypothetical protein